MNLSDLVKVLDKRPGMYTGEKSFGMLCSFLDGFNLARDGGPLAGFREWLVPRANDGNNLHWSGLVKLIIVPNATPPLSSKQDEMCMRGALTLLSEYLAYRENVGITKIHYEYGRWLLRKSWYAGPLRKNPL